MANRSVDKYLRFVLEGDAKSATTAMLEFEAAAAKSEKATADMAVKITDDLKKMEAQAKVAAESIGKIGQSAGGGTGGGGISDLFTAGFAGGVGGALTQGIQQLGTSLINFGEQSVNAFTRATDAVRIFSQTTGASAEESSRWINAGQLLGISAETMNTMFGRFGATVQQNIDKLRDHGVAIAADAQGHIDLIKTMENVQATIQKSSDASEKDALAKLVSTRNYTEFAQILHLTKDQMDQLMSAAGSGPILNQEDVNKGQELKIKLGEMNEEIDKIKVAVGGHLLGDLVGTAKELGVVYDELKKIDDIVPHASEGFLHVVKGLAEATPGIGAAVSIFDMGKTVLDHFGQSATDSGSALSSIPPAAGDAAGSIDEMGKQATIAEGRLTSLTQSIQQARSAWSSFQANENFGENADDAFTKALDAFDTGAAKAGGAAGNLAYDQEQGAQRIADAQQRIADAEESSSRRITDAQTRVKEAREQATQALLSAQQAVEDAQQRVVDEQLAGLRDSNPFQAQNRVDHARQELARAQGRLSTTQDTNAENIARAELESQRAQEDGTKSITKAKQELVKVQEEVAHSLDHAGASAASAGQKVGDLKKLVDDLVTATGNDVDAMAIQGQSLDQINGKVDLAKQKIQDMGTAWGWPQSQIDAYKTKLDAIPAKVMTTIGLTLDSYQFKVDVNNLMAQFSPLANSSPLAGLVRAGIEGALANPGGQSGIPNFDTGGVVPGGIGQPQLAIVHGGETVVPYGGGLGGATLVVNNYAPTFSEYEFADMVNRAVKQGIIGIRS